MENPSHFNGLDNVSVWLPKPGKIFPYFLTVSEAKKEKVFTSRERNKWMGNDGIP